jgi:DNA-binding transcriptional regulator YhcF (GntR family)
MMAKKNRSETIAELIERKILAGTWEDGDILPGERKLAELYGVSYMTMRQVVNSLVQKKLLKRMHGAGTFVQKPPPYQFGLLMGFPIDKFSADKRSPFVRMLLENLRIIFKETNSEFRTYIFLGDENIEDEIQYGFLMDDIRNGRVRSLIVEPVVYKEELVKIHNTLVPVTISAATDLKLNTVYWDFEQLGRTATEYLLGRNVEKLVLCDAYKIFENKRGKLLSDMNHGVLESALKLGFPPGNILLSNGDKKDLERLANKSAKGNYGLIFNDDFMARYFIESFISCGGNPERNLNLVSLSNLGSPTLEPYAEYISQYEYNPSEAASSLIKLAMESSSSKDRHPRRICLEGRPVFRQVC